jgi:hypothetical protein
VVLLAAAGAGNLQGSRGKAACSTMAGYLQQALQQEQQQQASARSQAMPAFLQATTARHPAHSVSMLLHAGLSRLHHQEASRVLSTRTASL